MQYETAFGLRKRHTFDETRRYVQNDPDKIHYPKRDALFLQKSHIYAQVEAAMRNYGDDAQVDQARYRASEQSAPYAPPKPKPPEMPPMDEDPLDDPMYDPSGDPMDEIAGAPPPPPPGGAGGYAQWLQRPNATAQGLAAEGVQPAPPPPPPPQLTEYNANYQPPPPPPASGSVAMAYPVNRPQSFAPDVFGGYTGPPQPPPSGNGQAVRNTAYPVAQPQFFAPEAFGGYNGPPQPPPPGAGQAVRDLAHTAGHSFASSAGSAAEHAVGGAAIAALLARTGLGAQMGVEGGPAGVLAGAVAGAAVGVGEMAVQGLVNRGGTGGNSAPTRQESGTISGFRPQGRNIDQPMIAAQQRAHTSGGSTAAFTGSARTMNGLNEGHQPRDRQVRTRVAPAPAQTIAPAAPVAAGGVAMAPAALRRPACVTRLRRFAWCTVARVSLTRVGAL